MERLTDEQLFERFARREDHQVVLRDVREWRPRYVGTLYQNQDQTIKGYIRDPEGNRYRVRWDWEGIKTMAGNLVFEIPEGTELTERFLFESAKTFKGAIKWPLCKTEPVSMYRRTRTNAMSGRVTMFELYTRKRF